MSDYLSDEEQVAALRKWWKQNGTFLVLAFLVVAGGLFGWRWYQEYARSQDEEASKIYQEYLEIHSGQDTQGDSQVRQAKLIGQLDKDYPKSSYETFTLFYRASDALQAGKQEQAEQLLRRVLKQALTDEMRDLARTRLARLLQQSGKAEEALALLSAVTSAGYLSLAAELKGDILAVRGDATQARAAYELAMKEKNMNDKRPILELKLANLAKTHEVTP